MRNIVRYSEFGQRKHHRPKGLNYLLSMLFVALLLLLSACGTQQAPTLENFDEMALDEVSAIISSEDLGQFDVLSTQAAGQGDLLDRRKMTPTGWWYFAGATASQLSAKISEGYRIFDLEIYSVSPLLFNAVMVRNSGEYASGWWWYYGQTAAQVSQLITNNQARIIDVESYLVNGQRLFAVVMLPNSGASAKSWWWYYGQTWAQVGQRVSSLNARIIDLDRYVVNGTTYYDIVLVPNSGADAKTWWYFSGLSASQVASNLSSKRARLTDLETYDTSSGPRFSGLMERVEGETWWWYYGLTFSQIGQLTAQNGARLIDIESYSTSGGIRYSVVMLRNVNDLTNRMRAYIGGNQSGGAYGLYLKQVNSSVLGALQENYIFEPASTIKALHHVHAMKQVQLGNISLNSTVNWFQGMSGSCPVDSSPSTGSLQTGLSAMMMNSDNAWTQAMRVRFGEANINATAQALGMTNTLLRHRIGCASGTDGAINEPNRLTLVDIGRLYEQVATGYLGNQRQNFYNLMLTGLGNISTVIDQEAAKLGLSNTVINDFKNRVRAAAKAGNYTLNSKLYLTIGGWSSLPFKTSAGSIVNREYTYGMFIHNANTINASFSIWDARGELLRDEIAKALKTFK
ncbi:MAG: serine hydrolase [Deinococcales bacterium]